MLGANALNVSIKNENLDVCRKTAGNYFRGGCLPVGVFCSKEAGSWQKDLRIWLLLSRSRYFLPAPTNIHT